MRTPDDLDHEAERLRLEAEGETDPKWALGLQHMRRSSTQLAAILRELAAGGSRTPGEDEAA
ncbi:hypothetical protein SGCZBJ_20315 [Caulobacter zeae]|uniref:Uncharacterized protein n=1 Tax=Caulobacter zeae TaxID=2055137 RepID=A0A2N5D775_9CAUL|nr:hypothetical protein [Caulobacter zeae]PLR21914.1 hypothetical protein SGCZBJ_20315 [Caulobacter zeae]